MIIVWWYTIASVILVSSISLIGLIIIAVQPDRLRSMIFVLVSLAAGSMFGDVFIHLFPESYRHSDGSASTGLAILAGIFGFFILEKFLRWRHEHIVETQTAIATIGYLNLLADGVHNLIDGMLIAAAYIVSLPAGIATTIAITLHEIPQEIGDFGILVHAGMTRTKALAFNLLSASLAVIGALIVLVANRSVTQFAALLIPLTAGSFIYIAGSDLLPELHKEVTPRKSAIQLIAMVFGVGIMLLVAAVE